MARGGIRERGTGAILRLLGVSERVTQLDADRQDAVIASQRLAAIIASSSDAIVTGDFDRHITSWNPAAEHLLGYRADEIVGQDAGVLLGTGAGFPDEHLATVLAGGIATYEGTRVRRDGVELSVSISAFPIRGADGSIEQVGAILRDLGPQKALEERLRDAQRLEAVGRLTGGIAHDFNNMLSVISGYAASAAAGVDPESQTAADLQEVRQAAERATALTRQLLAFSRQQMLDPMVLDLRQVVADVLPTLQQLTPGEITVVSLPDADPVAVYADRDQLTHVIHNLVVNARDAMPHGGTVTIATYSVSLPGQDDPSPLDLEPGRYALLTVTDTGEGMDAGTLSMAFEPFFTTRPVGEGAGLGLATVHGVVSQSGGAVRADSEPGQGSTFEVYLPAVAPASVAPAARPTASVPALAEHGGETVLICDDEEQVARLVARTLRTAGYGVLVALDPAEALTLLDAHQGPVHAIVSDVVMPDLTGPELVEQIRERRGPLPAVFVSGYTSETIRARDGLPEASAFVQKPFTSEDLLGTLRSVLDATRTGPEMPQIPDR